MKNAAAFPIRRSTLLASLAILSFGCKSENPRAVFQKKMEEGFTPEEKAWRARFHDVNGYAFLVDAIESMWAVSILDERGGRVAGGANFSPRNSVNMSSSSFYGVARSYRVVWREGDWQLNNEPRDERKITMTRSGTFEGGTKVHEKTIIVADRIPEELLVKYRQARGALGLRIKIRLHPDGPLLGWDLGGAQGTGADGSRYTMAGGDFQEAYIVEGKALRMGWYIHPKTKERIETAF